MPPQGAQMLAKKQQLICHFLANISMDQKSSHHPHPEVMHAMSLLALHVLGCPISMSQRLIRVIHFSRNALSSSHAPL